MRPRMHIFMSALTHSDQVFLGLPLLLALGIIILVLEFMHEEECAACPHHLKRLVRRADVTTSSPQSKKVYEGYPGIVRCGKIWAGKRCITFWVTMKKT